MAQTVIEPFKPSTIISKKYFPSLDGFRALSIIIVIAAHLSHTTKFYLTHPVFDLIIGHGILGVSIFFVISGFLITTLLTKEKAKEGTISLRNFYIRRAFRILPILFLFFVIMLVLNSIFKLNVPFLSFAGPMLFLGNIRAFNKSIYFSHFWSLAYEEQFYFLIPYFLKRNIDGYFKGMLVYLLVFPLIILFYGLFRFESSSLSHVFRFLYLFYPLVVGSFASIVISKNLLRINLNFAFTPVIFVILFLTIFLLNTDSVGNIKAEYIVALKNIINYYLIAMLIVVSISLKSENFIYKIFNNKLIMKIGVLSYSLYIFQQLFTTQIPWVNTFKYSNSVLLNLLILTIVAFLSYNFYELPFLKLKQKFK